MVNQKKSADQLRFTLRAIPEKYFIIVDECRLWKKGDAILPNGVGRKGNYTLLFSKGKASRVILYSLSPPTIPLETQEEMTAVSFHFVGKERLSDSRSGRNQGIEMREEFSGFFKDETGPMEWYEGQFSFLYHEFLDSLGDFRRGLCSSLVHLILCQMVLSAGSISRPSYSRSDLMAICQLIKNQPEKRFTLPELAERAGLSPRHFARIFSEELGLSPKQYELHQRMAYARFLIRERGCNVQETAARCGYTDPFLFSRQFKKAFGRSPGHQTLS